MYLCDGPPRARESDDADFYSFTQENVHGVFFFWRESYRNYSVGVSKQTVVLQHAGRYRNASPSIVLCKRLYRLALILAGEKEKTGGGLKWLLVETQGQRQSDLMGSLSVMPLLL